MAFRYANLNDNQMAEWGYIRIKELLMPTFLAASLFEVPSRTILTSLFLRSSGIPGSLCF